MEYTQPRQDYLRCGTAVYSLQRWFAVYCLLSVVLEFDEHISRMYLLALNRLVLITRRVLHL
jgi:hypothetical protein